MQRGMLSDLFIGVVAKKLTLVETVTKKSNQHEIQGTRPLRNLLGDEDRREIPTRFIWVSEDEKAITEDGFVSWSNVRKGKPRAAEYHLYYSGNTVTDLMQIGDMLFLALKRDGSILVVVTSSATIQNQLQWLFSLEETPQTAFTFQEIKGSHNNRLDFAARYILDELGIEPEEPEADRLDALIEPFGLNFPKTSIFSTLARNSLSGEISAADDPDLALVSWMEREEQLFRRLERRIVAARISEGFLASDGVDVDGFIAFSLSVHNRRKSRAGQALENHLEAVFNAQGISYSRGAETENRNKPDFLFPGKTEYHDPHFPAARLTMLGAKSTLKDRWRQVLSEAARIKNKHLLTLEPGISENQTSEMQAKQLQLVIPSQLHETYRPVQKAWLIDMKEFIKLTRKRQKQ